jgi:hypothetical protein
MLWMGRPGPGRRHPGSPGHQLTRAWWRAWPPGADSIDDMDLLRDGAMETVFGGVRAPSTLGSFLRAFTWGNVRQIDAAHRKLTAALAADPRPLPGREALTFIDVDSTQESITNTSDSPEDIPASVEVPVTLAAQRRPGHAKQATCSTPTRYPSKGPRRC